MKNVTFILILSYLNMALAFTPIAGRWNIAVASFLLLVQVLSITYDVWEREQVHSKRNSK